VSNTPRTDAAAFKQDDGTIRYSTTTGARLKIVTANFARDLERELAEALALLRELNDALVIPGWLQPRVDAVLDRAEEK
jgi:hypothetical protein